MAEKWRLIELDDISGIESQTVYHTVGIAMEKYDDIPNTIIICWPKDPLVCVGYHQIIEEEVEVEYCKKNNLPIVRRPLGGGAVYLDSGQLFYQLIARLDTKKIPREVSAFYEKILKAPIRTYQSIGIDAHYAPINDIEAEGKKISGNGAAMVGGGRILTGNLIFDFNFDEMIKILKVPNEKFRDKVAQGLRQRLGTIAGFLGNVPDRQLVKKILIEKFEEILDVKFERTNQLSPRELEINDEILAMYRSEEWLNITDHRRSQLLEKRKIKISTKTQIYEAVHKAPGGLIRLFMEIDAGKIKDILISGDFSANPMNAPELIENSLLELELDKENILNSLKQLYETKNIDTPGVTPEDIATAIELSVKDLF
ncbi:MAG: lipoate--protein ligase [Candidatus Thorarchaeota archaeon]